MRLSIMFSINFTVIFCSILQCVRCSVFFIIITAKVGLTFIVIFVSIKYVSVGWLVRLMYFLMILANMLVRLMMCLKCLLLIFVHCCGLLVGIVGVSGIGCRLGCGGTVSGIGCQGMAALWAILKYIYFILDIRS